MKDTRRPSSVLTYSLTATLLLSCGGNAAVTWTNAGGDNDYTNDANWDSAPGAFPASDTVIINQTGANGAVLSGGSPANTDALRVGYDAGPGSFTQTGGTLTVTSNSSGITRVGRNQVGDWTMSGGTATLNRVQLGLGTAAGREGNMTVTGGDMVILREGGGVSLAVDLDGGSGTASFAISGGSLKTRAGVNVGDNGTFAVLGVGATEIGIGSQGTLDGGWTQATGGTLRFGVDGASAGGTTNLLIDVTNGTGVGAGNVNFAAGALLDVDFFANPQPGSWDVMNWEGSLTDDGLALAPGTPAGWSFSFEDTGVNGGGNDTLRLTFIPEPSSAAFMVLALGAGLARRRR